MIIIVCILFLNWSIYNAIQKKKLILLSICYIIIQIFSLQSPFNINHILSPYRWIFLQWNERDIVLGIKSALCYTTCVQKY